MLRSQPYNRIHRDFQLEALPKYAHLREAPAESCPAFPMVKAEGGLGGAKEAHIADHKICTEARKYNI